MPVSALAAMPGWQVLGLSSDDLVARRDSLPLHSEENLILGAVDARSAVA